MSFISVLVLNKLKVIQIKYRKGVNVMNMDVVYTGLFHLFFVLVLAIGTIYMVKNKKL